MSIRGVTTDLCTARRRQTGKSATQGPVTRDAARTMPQAGDWRSREADCDLRALSNLSSPYFVVINECWGGTLSGNEILIAPTGKWHIDGFGLPSASAIMMMLVMNSVSHELNLLKFL